MLLLYPTRRQERQPTHHLGQWTFEAPGQPLDGGVLAIGGSDKRLVLASPPALEVFLFEGATLIEPFPTE